MFARVSRFEGSPEGMDEALRHVREHVLPQIQRQDGSKGLIALRAIARAAQCSA